MRKNGKVKPMVKYICISLNLCNGERASVEFSEVYHALERKYILACKIKFVIIIEMKILFIHFS